MTEFQFHQLLRKYLAGELSASEHDRFFEAIQDPAWEAVLKQSIVEDLHREQGSDTPAMPPHIAQDVLRRIHLAARQADDSVPTAKPPVWRLSWVRWSAAAVLLALVSVFGVLFWFQSGDSTDRAFTRILPKQAVQETNTSDRMVELSLPDGSQVWLQPGSSLYYQPDAFNQQQREVYLKGEAFFQVASNPQKPFLVYYREIVTRVLGTSFRINTNPKTGHVEVAVKTGRVQVFENKKILDPSRETASVIVTPNQKAVYAATESVLFSTVVDLPTPITTDRAASRVTATDPSQAAAPVWRFNQTDFGDVLHRLEAAYGIEIMTEHPGLLQCQFTGDLSDTDLFTQLRIICLATGSSYEVMGTRILIKGVGCGERTD